MNLDKLKEIMHFHNPWWVHKNVPEELLQDYQRPILKTLLSYLGLDRVIVIKGPRRTGKTTLMYQMASQLLNEGTKPEDIFFLSFDDLASRVDFDEIIKIYQQLTRRVLNKQSTIYVFLDEVQFLENWSLYIKRYFDKRYPLKFILSGSAASLIKKGAESLAGRTIEETIRPFSFYEYLEYHVRDKKLKEIVDELKDNFHFQNLPSKDVLMPYETKIKIIFEEYLYNGGFPRLSPALCNCL